ncbi:MAG: MFS transporter [Truepera sp.]|nr:MFS transporter [Truepera sp.]
MKHPIHNANFRILFVARFIDELSLGFFTIPLFWWILTVAESPSLVAVAALAGSLSYLVAAPWGGVLADRWRKKYVIVSSNLLGLTLAAVVGVLIYTGLANFYWVLGFLIGSSLASAAREPSLSALLPLLLAKEQYQRGNATIGLVAQFARLSAFAIAGIVTAALGVAAAIFIGVGSLLISVVIMLFLKEPAVSGAAAPEAAASQGTQKRTFLLAGFRLLGRTPLLLSLVLTATLLNFILSPLAVILAPYAEQLGAGAQGFGSLAAAMVAGNILGLGLMNLVSVKRPLRMLVGGTMGMALAMLVMAFSHDLWLAMAAISFAGMCGAMMGVQLSTVVQKNVPRELMGRTVGVMSALGEGAMPAGYAVAGLLLAVVSVSEIFIGMFVLTALASLVWLRPSVRHSFRPEVKEEAARGG